MTYFASFFGPFPVLSRYMWLMAGVLNGTTRYTVLQFFSSLTYGSHLSMRVYVDLPLSL